MLQHETGLIQHVCAELSFFVLAGLILCVIVPLTALAQDTLLRPENVAIVVNEAEPNSVEGGEYLRKARGIPEENVIRVSIPGSPRSLTAPQFEELRKKIAEQLRPEIDVIVLAWTMPYAVECNSITAALTLGFDAGQCANTCAPGKPSRYFDSQVRRPYAELGLRLSMLLPTADLNLAKAVVDRGKLTGFRLTEASAYFVITPDPVRNNRAPFFPPSQRIASRLLSIETLRADGIQNRRDVMVYETGAVSVPYLDTLTFLPGALADHLTSAGGDLLGQSQMSSLRWLQAGATASYGTVSEPCNYWQKFPNPAVLLKHYLVGESAIEAYWKSVAWPAQGLFIGEPLAAPYCLNCSTISPAHEERSAGLPRKRAAPSHSGP